MKTNIFNPSLEYPYLAVYGKQTDLSFIRDIKPEDIIVVSLVTMPSKGDKEVYVQRILGGAPAFVTQKEEEDYTPLPKGFKVEITQ